MKLEDRKQTVELALRESEERYRLLFETSRDAIMTLAPPSWNFTSGNAAAFELFGMKDEKTFISAPPWKYSPESQPDGQSSANKAKKMIDTAMEKGSNFFEWTHKKLNGVHFFATVLLTRISIGEKIFLQATVRDITERKKAEEELKKHREHLEDMVARRTTALSEIIAQIEVEKRKIKNDVAANVNELLFPILEKLKLKNAAGKYVDLLKSHLEELVSSFGRKIRGKRLNLTPREVEICNMIKGRLTSKEISVLLNISLQTVEKHRKNIRRKMGISKKDINLTSFLQTI
ncbi:PAS domain S-box protein [bacterium]|nr:PAS domain S-box protein [bacterium]